MAQTRGGDRQSSRRRREVRAETYEPQVEPGTLGYAIVRLGEAFLFNDAVAGMRGDVERLREVEAAILGVARGAEDRLTADGSQRTNR